MDQLNDDENQWFPFVSNLDNNNGALTFEVKASNDVHVALGANSVDYRSGGRIVTNHYEIVLGGWGDALSVMR